MKIYLLNPPYFPHFGRGARWQDTGRGGTLYYPIWLSYAASVLDTNHQIKLVDAPAWNWTKEDAIEDIRHFNPDLIVLDSSFPSLNNDINMAIFIKSSYIGAKIALVGPTTSQFADYILNNSAIDIAVRWEYDFTLNDIAESLECGKDFRDIDGISYKLENKNFHNPNRAFTDSDDLNTIPFVSKTYKKYLNIEDYFLGQSLYPEVQIFTGRGCPNRCTFCSWPQTLMGRKYRVRSIGNVLDELEWISANLKVKEVFFEDDTFTINKKRVLEFCEEYKSRELNITWACNARVDTLDLDTMRAMKKANCRLLIAGYESGSDEILKKIQKGTNVEQIKQFASNAKKARLLVHGDVIIGLPGETRETISATRRLIFDTKPDILQVSIASPFPGTNFYNWCKESGFLITEDLNDYLDKTGHQKPIIAYPWLSHEEITKAANQLLKDYYVSMNYLPLAINQVLRRQGIDELKRLLYSTKMFLKYINKQRKDESSIVGA